MQLRYLQTVVEVAAENNSTTLFPITMDLFAPFLKGAEPVTEEARARAMQASMETMIESLPAGEEFRAIEAATRKIIAKAKSR